MAQKLSGQLAYDILDEFPDATTRALARILYRDNPEVYNSTEHARSLLNAYRGTCGGRLRNRIKSNKHFKTMKYDLPEPEQQEYLPYILPKAATKILILSDLHIPYHDNEAIKAALDYGRVDRDINTILLNGDIMDFYSLSRFVKDPRARSLKQELEDMKKFLGVLGDYKIYYKLGNHEERLEKYLMIKAPELLGITEFELQNLLGFGSRGIELINDQRIVMAGKLPILHGHEFWSKSTGGVNPARSLFLKSSKSALVAHSHRTSIHTEMDLMGKIITCWSVGGLCQLHPEYARINKWNHGAAFVEIDKEGGFKVDNFRISEGKVL